MTFVKHRLSLLQCFLLFLFGIAANEIVADPSIPIETNRPSFGGDRHDFIFDGNHKAFVILPKGGMTKADRPWIWYAPTLVNNKLPGAELQWLFPRLLQSGFGIAGIDVGESYGNPTGRKIYSQFHAYVIKTFGFSCKASLLPQSRGGLMLYNWAVEHPECVQCIGGIYTVCNLASYPGLEKAAPAYDMPPEALTAHLSEHNPIDRLEPLAEANVPIFHIHGDADKIVPLEKNAGELVKRYRALGGNAQLTIVPGKGHEVCPEFFQSQALLDFFLLHDGSNVDSFQKIQLTDQFWSEGANVGDFNNDGKMDVVSGPFWYEGPDFKKRHEYSPATQTFKKKSGGAEKIIPGFEGGLGTNNAYSSNFFAFTYDFNHDGWTDILILGYPGKESWWFENPPGQEGHWTRHLALNETGNESPTFTDLTGKGGPEIVCFVGGDVAYAKPDNKKPANKFVIHRISKDLKYRTFTHGLGVGNINGDGRKDVVIKDGWYEQPQSLAGDPAWKFHPAPFAPAPSMGSAQMYVYDVNGDGLPDVITSLAAHGYGLAWFEQKPRANAADDIEFEKHIILDPGGKPNKFGVSFSQLHAVDLIDVDGDGLKDIVTGKRFWAHGIHGDVQPNAPAVLYWFQLVRRKDKTVEYIPHLIDNDSGTGTQVVAWDVNGDNLPDVVVGNKKGTFVHIQKRKDKKSFPQ